jgi:hypothetical protein
VYLADVKASFINNYDVNIATERLIRLYVADIEGKIAAKKVPCLKTNSEEGDDDGEYDDDSEEEEEEEEEEEDEEEESESEESDEDDSDESSSSSSSSEKEDEDSVDFKVVIESSNMEPEVRGEYSNTRIINTFS